MDIVCHRRDDLAISTTREKHLTDLTSLRKGLYDIVAMSPPRSTFSRATWASFRGPRPVRSYAQPRGLERLTAKERDRAIIGNIFADFSFEVAKLALQSALSSCWNSPKILGLCRPTLEKRPATMWQWPQHAELVKQGLRSVCFHQSHFGTGYPKPTRLLLKTGLGFPDFVREGLPLFDDLGYYAGPLPKLDAQATQRQPCMVASKAKSHGRVASPARLGYLCCCCYDSRSGRGWRSSAI